MPKWTEEQKQAARDRAALRRAEKEWQALEMPEAQGAAEPSEIGGDQEISEPSASPVPVTEAKWIENHEQQRISEEVKKLVDELLAKKDAEAKKQARKEAFEAELLRQKRLAGLIDHQDDIVEYRVNVAPFSPGLTIDGHHYPHGSWIKTTRREYESNAAIMADSWRSEDRAGNPNKRHAQERALYGGIDPMLMETRMPDGTFTLGLSNRIVDRNGAAFMGPH